MIAKFKLYLKRSIKILIRILCFYAFGYMFGMGIWIIGLIPLSLGGLVYLIINYFFFRFELGIDPLGFWITNELFHDILFHGMAVLVALFLGLYPAIKNPDIGIVEENY